MKRVPGHPSQKLSYLKNLDEDQFLFLVADILYFVYNHTGIKILDGPGDGRRDIQSYNKEGELCITQCKFHKDYNRSVSSRETDDIVIALSKFNVKNGVFATSGKLSPQAKREYVDNFKDYRLLFLEGTDIVDLVLSSSILTSVWINNGSIELSNKILALPFILRDTKNDQSIEKVSGEGLPDDLWINETSISQDYFHPYRKPNYPSLRESGFFLTCFNLIYKGPVQFQSLQQLYESLTEKLLDIIRQQFSLVSLRIGSPYILEDIENENKGRLKLENRPMSYIICNGKSYKEKDYIIPVNDSRFVFPANLGTLEADWAAWFLPTNNICLQVYLVASGGINNDRFMLPTRETYLQKLDESLFFILTIPQYNQLSDLLNKEQWPDWSCEYGLDGKIVGWLHPYILKDRDYTSFKIMDDRFVLIENENKRTIFQEKTSKIKELLVSSGYKVCPTKKAISLSADSSLPIYVEHTSHSYETAQLFHFFKDINSPIDINERFFNFICVWDVPNYDFSREIIRYILGLISKKTTDPLFDICTTAKMKKMYAKLEIEFAIPVDCPVVDFLDNSLAGIVEIINLVEEILKSRYPGATRETDQYYLQEIGILFK